jgi:hypothetical protein
VQAQGNNTFLHRVIGHPPLLRKEHLPPLIGIDATWLIRAAQKALSLGVFLLVVDSSPLWNPLFPWTLTRVRVSFTTLLLFALTFSVWSIILQRRSIRCAEKYLEEKLNHSVQLRFFYPVWSATSWRKRIEVLGNEAS